MIQGYLKEGEKRETVRQNLLGGGEGIGLCAKRQESTVFEFQRLAGKMTSRYFHKLL